MIHRQEPVHYLPHDGPVNMALFHPHKPYIVTAGDDGRAHVWHTGQWNLETRFPSNGKVRTLQFAPWREKQVLEAVIEADNRMQHWRFSNDYDSQNPHQETAAMSSVLLTPDGKWLVLADSPVSELSRDHRYLATVGLGGINSIKELGTHHVKTLPDRRENSFAEFGYQNHSLMQRSFLP